MTWFLIVPLAAAVLTWLLGPVAGRVARAAGAVDAPGGRRLHQGVIPRGGGLAIGSGFLLVATTVTLAAGSPALTADNPDAGRLVAGLLLGSVVALVVGWVDDLRNLSPRAQLAGQGVIAAAASAGHLWLQTFSNPFTGAPVDLRADVPLGLAAVLAVTFIWYAGFINTLNWLDGIDGLAASVSAIAAVLFAAHMVVAFDQRTLALFPLALAGACLGFLPQNLWRPRLFMGSSGSTLLGFALAALALMAPAKVATALLVMAIPIVDVGWLIVYRLRRGRVPWRGDRGHLHHRLYDRGWSSGQVVLLYAGLAMALGTIAVLVPQSVPHRATVKLAALVAVGATTLAGLWNLARSDEGPSPT